ncbi:ATP-NAD kinase-like domain-containing protein [Xylariaceae sp. FL0016]|nr:ATP-NAD kinase-like domain-containing protein [Xylariaceae sp. FL0016]
MATVNADSVGDKATNSVTSEVKPEEVVCILQNHLKSGGHVIVSLVESRSDSGTSFRLTESPCTAVPPELLDHLVNELPEHLCGSTTRQVHVLVSKLSGTGLASEFYETALAPLFATLASYLPNVSRDHHVKVTEDEESIKTFSRGLSPSSREGTGAGKRPTILLLSGDGGVVEILNAREPADKPADDAELPLVVLFPLGTGNALFNSLHKTAETSQGGGGGGAPPPSIYVQSLRTLLKGRAAPLPSFGASFPPGSRTIAYREADANADAAVGEAKAVSERSAPVAHLRGVVVASYGFHSQLVWESDTPAYRAHGAARFQMAAAELLAASHAYDARVELLLLAHHGGSSSSPGREAAAAAATTTTIDRPRHAYVLATLVSNLEKTFCISPASRPLDGRLRVVHFGPADGKTTMEIMMAAYAGGSHVGMAWAGLDGKQETLGYEEVDEIRVTTHEKDARWRKVCIDGTIVELPEGGCMTVKKEARARLQVLIDPSIVKTGM